MWSYIKQWTLIHILFGYVFITSGLIVNFLMLCSCIIWPFSRTLYRKINRHLAYSIWSQLVCLGEWWSGTEVEVYTDMDNVKYYGKEHSLVVMNHKYDVDWLMGWILSERLGVLGGTKVYVKNSLRYVPVIGWSWHFTETLFLKRDIEKDKKTIKLQLEDLADYPMDQRIWILLFCEGTRFTEKKRDVSNEVARKKGLPELKHHLLPRTKGFALSMYSLKGIMPAMYSCVIGFTDEGAEPTLLNILNGKRCTAQLKVRRIPLENVPDDEEECSKWLYNLYKEMDDIYDEFDKNGTFTGSSIRFPRRKYDLLVAVFWAVLLCTPLFYYISRVLISGTIYMQLGIIIGVISVSVLIRLMIAVTEIERGSSYGKGRSMRRNGPKKDQ